jgi:hypothetical protein
MELYSQYDFVILGEHPAALWAALQLLRLEQRVLVLPLGGHSGANLLPRNIVEGLGWNAADWPDRSLDPIQILTSGHRFRLGSTLEEVSEEYRFQFGRELTPGERIGVELNRGLLHLFRGYEGRGNIIPGDGPGGFEGAMNTLYQDGEPGQVVRTLLKRLEAEGAHVARSGQLRRVFLDRKAFVGVQLSGTSRMTAGRHAIVGTHFDQVKPLLSEEIALSSKPTGWWFESRFECSPSVIPVGLGTRMVFVEKDAPVLEILRETPGRFKLRVQLPMKDASLARDEQRRMAGRMLGVCQGLIPDLEYNLRQMTPDLRDPERAETVDLPRLFPFEDLSRIPLDRRIYDESAGLPVETPVTNLFLVGDESEPGKGIRGAFDAALKVFDAVAKKDQRPEFARLGR